MEIALVKALRANGFDVMVPIEIGMETATDEEHLRLAAGEGRLLISHDLRDFSMLAEDWFLQGMTHSGILLAEQPPRLPLKECIARVLTVLDSRTA